MSVGPRGPHEVACAACEGTGMGEVITVRSAFGTKETPRVLACRVCGGSGAVPKNGARS